MKKVVLLIIAMFIAVGAVSAMGAMVDLSPAGPSASDASGFYVGTEFGAQNLEYFDDTMFVTPYLGYGYDVNENINVFGQFDLGLDLGGEDLEGAGKLAIGGSYTMELDFGSLYFGLVVPMYLFGIGDYTPDPFDFVGLDLFV